MQNEAKEIFNLVYEMLYNSTLVKRLFSLILVPNVRRNVIICDVVVLQSSFKLYCTICVLL